MIAIHRLAMAAVIGCAAVAASGHFAPIASAGPERTTFTIAFDYDHGKSAEHNYGAFLREARRACATAGVRQLEARLHDQECIAETVDAFVRKLGRIDVAALHFDRTGRQIDSSRTLAAR